MLPHIRKNIGDGSWHKASRRLCRLRVTRDPPLSPHLARDLLRSAIDRKAPPSLLRDVIDTLDYSGSSSVGCDEDDEPLVDAALLGTVCATYYLDSLAEALSVLLSAARRRLGSDGKDDVDWCGILSETRCDWTERRGSHRNRNLRGGTPLHVLCSRGDATLKVLTPLAFGPHGAAAIRTRTATGGEPNLRGGGGGDLPIHLLCDAQRPENWGDLADILDFFREIYPAVLTAWDGAGRTPLHRLLCNKERRPPSSSSRAHLLRLVEFFLEVYPAILTAEDGEGQTPLAAYMRGAGSESDPEIIMALLPTDNDDTVQRILTAKSKAGRTPLQWLCYNDCDGWCGATYEYQTECSCSFAVPEVDCIRMLLPRDREGKRSSLVSVRPGRKSTSSSLLGNAWSIRTMDKWRGSQESVQRFLDLLLSETYECLLSIPPAIEDIQESEGGKEKEKGFTLLHAAFGLPICPHLSHLRLHYLYRFPEFVSVPDIRGRLPIHLAMMNPAFHLQEGPPPRPYQGPPKLDRLEEVLVQNPDGLGLEDGRGRLPLHCAIACNKPFYHLRKKNSGSVMHYLGQVGLLVKLAPESLYVKDGVTGLYPALLAAAADLGMVTENTASSKGLQPSEDIEGLEQLNTVFELLRLLPSIISMTGVMTER